MSARFHIWSYPDDNGAKHCLVDGCTVRTRRAYAQWQSAKGARWVSILGADAQGLNVCRGRLPPRVTP